MRGRAFTTLALATSVSHALATAPINSPADALAQFAPLLSPSTFGTLQTALTTIPAALPLFGGLPVGNGLADPFESALATAKLAGSRSNAATLDDLQSVRASFSA